MLLLRGVTTSYQVSESRQKYISNHMVGGTLEYIEYRSQFLIIVVNLQPLEIISGGFLLQKWGLKMKKIFTAIFMCMIFDMAYGGGGYCEPGYWQEALIYAPDWTCSDICPEGYYCPGGDIVISNKPDGGLIGAENMIIQCPENTTSPAGSDSVDDCVPITVEEVSCLPSYYLPAGSATCTQCQKNSYCPGGEYTQSGQDSGIIACPNDTKSPIGSDSADDCGRVLHIGEYILYLRTAKLTVPSLNVQIGNTIYYGDMFPA